MLVEKSKRDPMLVNQSRYGMDITFIVVLLLTSLTGLARLVWCETV